MKVRIIEKVEFQESKTITYYYPQYQKMCIDDAYYLPDEVWYFIRENNTVGDVIKSIDKEYISDVLKEWCKYVKSATQPNPTIVEEYEI